MSGETIKSRAVCLGIRPWSRTSHIVSWLTPAGRIVTPVKGAVRPKSAFLGQYDLNYTCDIVYYARERSGLHALRECDGADRRDALRGDWRSLALAEHFRALAAELAPSGPECADWFELLDGALARLAEAAPERDGARLLQRLLAYERRVLELAGLGPEIESSGGQLLLRGERSVPVPAETASCLRDPEAEKNPKILLDAARVFGVFYSFHLDCAPEVRRTLLRMICNNETRKEQR